MSALTDQIRRISTKVYHLAMIQPMGLSFKVFRSFRCRSRAITGVLEVTFCFFETFFQHLKIVLGDRESNGKYTFKAYLDGVYTFCLGNKMSTMTPKVVMFSIDVDTTVANPADGTDESAEHSKLGKCSAKIETLKI